MPPIDRTGQVFGSLTVVSDNGGHQLHCRCKCGREGSYSRSITKPSYRGPKACAWCLGSPCEVCGTIIPRKSGQQSATCSEQCRIERHNRIERERYYTIRDTEKFKETRSTYIEKIKQERAEDPSFDAYIRSNHQRAVRDHRKRQMSDEELRIKYVLNHREQERKRLERIRQDPEKYREHRKKYREWYDSLSDEDYYRIFIEPKKNK